MAVFNLFFVPKLLLLLETKLIFFYLYFLHPIRGFVACCHAAGDGLQGDSLGLGYQELPSSLSVSSEEKLLLRVR